MALYALPKRVGSLQAFEVLEGLQAGKAAVQGFAGGRSELTDSFCAGGAAQGAGWLRGLIALFAAQPRWSDAGLAEILAALR